MLAKVLGQHTSWKPGQGCVVVSPQHHASQRDAPDCEPLCLAGKSNDLPLAAPCLSVCAVQARCSRSFPGALCAQRCPRPSARSTSQGGQRVACEYCCSELLLTGQSLCREALLRPACSCTFKAVANKTNRLAGCAVPPRLQHSTPRPLTRISQTLSWLCACQPVSDALHVMLLSDCMQ